MGAIFGVQVPTKGDHDNRSEAQWIRDRLRAYQLHLWRRGPVIHRELSARGAAPDVAAKVAANSRRWWRNAQYVANIAFPNRYFIELGIPQLE